MLRCIYSNSGKGTSLLNDEVRTPDNDGSPNDLAIDILLKLPVKSLVRFRCLSKSYSAVIRSPDFIASHRKRNQDPQILLYKHPSVDKRHFTTLSADFLPIENIQIPLSDNCHPDVDGPCNGLLLLSEQEQLALWNPSTREFKLVPPSTIRRPPETHMVFEAVGFGFDSRSGEYKVIRFITQFYDAMDRYIKMEDQVEVYCLNSNSWREIAAPKDPVNAYPRFGDLENGLIHWVGRDFANALIISFDVTNESFTSTALPEFENKRCWWDFMKPVDGAIIRLIAYPRGVEERVFDVWSKKDRWIKELRIGPFSGIKRRPSGFWKNGQQMFLQSKNGELLLLDVETGEMKNFGVHASPRRMWLEVIVYSESLVPVNGRTEEQELVVRERFLDGGQLMRMKIM